MDVRCEKCSTEYEFDENRIGANGVTVKCTACGFVFKVRRPQRRSIPRATTTLGKGPQGREWLVRKPDGQMIAFRELTTLQKWIVEGRIGREDEISKNGETWKRLGNIMELEPFFTVYEKAQTLNSLIDQGGPGGEQLQLRGSELLAAISPVDAAEIAGPQYAIPSQSQIIQADSLPPTSRPRRPTSSVSVTPLSGQAPEGAPKMLPGNGMGSGSLAPTREIQSVRGEPVAAQRLDPAALPPPRPVPVRPPSAAHTPPPSRAVARQTVPAQLLDHDAVAATGLAGPGAFPAPSGLGSISPASFGRDSLDLPRPELVRDDPVLEFTRGQRRRRVAWALAVLLFAGAGAGVAVALYGPDGNPLKQLAARWGLLAPGADSVRPLVEDARRASDLDSIKSLKKAVSLMTEAHHKRPSDVAVVADRALAMALLGGAYVRWAQDLESSAAEAEKILAAWEAEQKPPPKRGRAEEAAPRPAVPDPDALRKDAREKRAQAAGALSTSAELAEAAWRAAPDTLEPARALATQNLASGDPGLEAALAKAKEASEKTGQIDAPVLYVEAAHAAQIFGTPTPEGLARADQLLEQARTTRPSMNRVRVLAARVRLAKDELDAAKRELEPVLVSAPDHEEALRLKERIAAIERGRAAEEAKAAAPPPEPAAPEPAPAAEPEKTFEYWMNLGDRLRVSDRTNAALNAYGRAAELNPNSAETHVGKGWCFLDLDQARLALISFNRAIKVNDRYAEAYYGLAEANRALGNKDEAIAAYERYLDYAPKSSTERVAAQRQLDALKAAP